MLNFRINLSTLELSRLSNSCGGEMIQPKIPIPQDKIIKFCQKNYIETMSLFGSVLTEQFKPTSDVDFLVEFQSGHIQLYLILSIWKKN